MAGLVNKDTEFVQFISDFDFIGLIETWVEKKDWSKKWENKLSAGYKWECQGAIRSSKHGHASGGIITGMRIELVGNKETVQCEGVVKRNMCVEEDDWSVWTVYNKGGNKELYGKMNELLDEIECEKIILGGDWNARIGQEGGIFENNDKRVKSSKDKICNNEGRELLKFVDDNGWVILNGNVENDNEGDWTFFRRCDKTNMVWNSVIDYGIMNWEGFRDLCKFEIGRRIDSDHQPIMITVNGKWEVKYNKRVNMVSKKKIQVWGG